METNELYLEIPTQLRYIRLGEQKKATHVIYVLHGYGQLVHYFSRKFHEFQRPNTTLIFPEGLHRFYLQGNSGRVGASWMTKEWREHDIQVNINALNKLHVEVSSQLTPSRVSVIGFSQGGATAARWIENGLIPCDDFISWASVFPPDLPLSSETPLAEKCIFAIGNQDPYFQGEDRAQMISHYQRLGFEICPFEGGHDIDLNILKTILP